MREVIAANRKEDGCILFAYGEDVLDPGLIRVVERWRDWDSLAAHGRSTHVATWRKALGAAGMSEREVFAHEAIRRAGDLIRAAHEPRRLPEMHGEPDRRLVRGGPGDAMPPTGGQEHEIARAERALGLAFDEQRLPHREARSPIRPGAGRTRSPAASLAGRDDALDAEPGPREKRVRLEAAEKTMVIESETLLSGYLLCSQGDRMSAAHAVEARYPFIDHDVAAAALRLPHEYRLKGNEREKHILKEAFRDIVPDSVINRPKYPFRAPDGELMLDKAFSKFMPGRDEILAAGIFDPDIAERFISRLTPTSIGQREMQALTVLVSTQMLHRQFCAGAMSAASTLNNLTVRADLRSAA